MEENLMINRYKRPRSISGRLADESGIVLIAALLVMIFLTFLGTTVVILSSSNIKVSRNNEISSQAFMVAEAGVAEAIDKLRTDTNWGPNTDENGTLVNPDWAPNSHGPVVLSGLDGQYNITLYDRFGSYGREANAVRLNNYATLGANEVLVEVSGTVDGFERKVSVIVRSAVEAFEYALFSEGSIDANGSGPNPGTINGKQYAKGAINWQGNYDLSQSEAVTHANNASPSCSSGQWRTCVSSATAIDAPLLDFAYYQDQTNFDGGANPQQVFVMTPTIGGPGNVANCAGPCNSTWMLRYAMQTLGNTYTLTARVEAIRNSANDWNNVVYYCANPNPANPWNGTDALCPNGGAPSSYLFNSTKAENTKPFLNAPQFNAYTAPTPPYTSSIVNVFDAAGHLEFLGPTAPVSTTVTATILVGTASDNLTPIGKIDIEGGAGALIFDPANGLAIVAETVKFVAKYSDINVTVGTTQRGAILIAKNQLKVEGEPGNNVVMTLNGSAIVGGDNLTGGADNNNNGSIEIDHTAQFNVNYVPPTSYPAGWEDYGSLKFERREWREL